MEAGASSFIEKPSVMQELLEAVGHSLELKGACIELSTQ
jgi:FixJ family two-component response regulator